MIMKAKAPKIAEGIYFVGTLDWDRREYHGYTLHGTSYNAFLVFSEDKCVLIDNVCISWRSILCSNVGKNKRCI